jgi:hypothetical protein
MFSTTKTRAAAGTLLVGFLLAIALTATAQDGNGMRFGLTPQQRKAEQARGNALNRYYHLGPYTVIERVSRFQWNDAAIGAAAMLGTILLAGGLAVELRRRANRPSGVALGDISSGRLR